MRLKTCLCSLLMASVGATAVAGQPKNPVREEIQLRINRDNRLGERVDVCQQELALAREDGGERGLISTAIGMTASYATKALVSLFDRRDKIRTSEWTAPVTRDYFYEKPSFLGALDPSGLQFKGFSLTRNVAEQHDSTLRRPVFYIECSMPESRIGDYITNSRFSLQLDTLAIDLSRVKARYTRKKRISIEITVKIRATWLDETLTVHKDHELGEFRIALPQLHYDPEKPVAAFSAERAADLMTGSCFFVPRSYGAYVDAGRYEPCWSNGEFDILVTVREATRGKRKKEHFMVEYLQQAIPSVATSYGTNREIVGPTMVKLIRNY